MEKKNNVLAGEARITKHTNIQFEEQPSMVSRAAESDQSCVLWKMDVSVVM